MDALFIRDVARREPRHGEKWFCQDWECPSKWQCEHHHGRSFAYNAMDIEDRTALITPDRPSFLTRCSHFRRDLPREWLKGFCEPMDRSWSCPGCLMPECPNGVGTVVALRQPRRVH